MYGSRAKGNYKPFSDVDITLEGAELTHTDLSRLSLAIDDLLLPYQFDISIFHTLKNEALIDHIRRMGITIYERESEWKEYKLGDLIKDIAAGPFGSNLKVECFVESGFPIIDGANLKGIKVTDNITKYVTEEKARSLHRAIAKRNDVVVTISGNVGQIAYIPDNSKYLEYLVSQRQFRATFDVTKVDVPFLVYYFHTRVGQHKILSFANQVGVPALAQPLKNFREIELELPPIEEQKRIAGVLSSLDDKIDLLHRENATLEQMAETLFRQWFVEDAKEDWEEVALGDVVKTTSGGTPTRKISEYYENGTINWVKSKELDGSFISSTEELITEEAVANSSAKMLPEKSVLIAMYGATVGEYGILSKPMTCNQAVCALIPNENYPYTYLFVWTALMKEDFINLASGAAQQNISQDLIKQQIVCSDLDRIKQYDKMVIGYFEKMENNQKQIQTLIQTRDGLLPKLMNNEIKIE